MPEIIDLRSLSEDKKKRAIERGINPDDTLFVFDDVKGEGRLVKKSEQGKIATFLGEAGLGILPTMGGMASAGAAGTAALPAGPVVSTAAGIGGAIAGGLGTSYLQDKALTSLAPEMMLEQDIRRRSNPITATLGQVASGLPFGMGFRGLLNAATKKEAAKMAAAPVALGGGLEAYNQYVSEGEPSPIRIGIAALGNLGQVDNTALGNFAEKAGKKLAGKLGGKVDTSGVPIPAQDPNTIDPYVTAAKTMEAFRGGQLAEGSELHKQLLRENNLDETVSVDTLVATAARLEQSAIRNKPELRQELAGKLFDALQSGQDPAVLAESKIETLIKDLYKSGDIKTREEAIRIAKSPNPAEELNVLKRERAENAGPPPVQPGTRLTDEQVDILLKAPPEIKPPNASKLDEVVLQGRKDGYINSPQDVRQLEDAYLVNPDNLPAASRALWEEKQARAAGPTAADVADAFERRDTEFFNKDFPKLVRELSAEQSQLGVIENLINDKNATETARALNRSRLDSMRKSVDTKWQKLLEKALSRYAPSGNPLAVGTPTKDFSWTPSGKPPKFTGDPGAPIIEADIVAENTFPIARPETAQPSIAAPQEPAGLLGRGPLVTPPPPTPKGLLGFPANQPNPTAKVSTETGLLGIKPKSWGDQPDENAGATRQMVLGPDFRKWFEGSKVVDKDGMPLKVYHITRANFNTFDTTINDDLELGTHFGTLPTVNNLEGGGSGRERFVINKEDANIMPTYLALKKPLRMPDIFPIGNARLADDMRRVADTVTDSQTRDIINQHLNDTYAGLNVTAAQLRQKLQERGYDGIVYDNAAEGGGDSWIVFDPHQIKSATGNRGTFDPNNPDIRFSGISPRVAKEFGRMVAKVADIVPRFVKEGKLLDKQIWSGTRSTMERIRALGPAGEAIRVADDRMNKDAIRTLNTAGRLYSEAYASLNPQSTSKVNRYLNDMQIAGESFVTLSPSEQAAVNKIRRGLLYLANQGIIRGGPGVSEGALFREMKIDPNYIPTIVDKRIRKLINQGGPEAAKYKQDWISWYQNKLDKSMEEAEQMMNQYLADTGSPNPLSAAQYNAITQAEGVGLPPSWRADPQKALMYHAFRAAKNYAWFTHVQKNPTVAKALGVTDDGWGGKIDISNIQGDSIGNVDAVKAWVAEQNLHMNQDEDMVEKLTRLATSFQLGPLTGLRDLIATPAHLAELIPAEEAGAVLTALKNVMTSDVRGGMEKQGIIRNKNLQPFEFLRAGNGTDAFDRVVEATRMLQGRNKLESGARQWAYEIGRLVASARLSKGDTKFFEHLDLPDYKNLTPEQLIEATGAKFVENAQGNYRSTGLPPWLLSGKQNKPLLAFLSLQRWSVERFNNWYDNAWKPAVEQGEFRPLLKSVFAGLAAGSAVETMQELLFNQKPKEMTWKEFMRAENKETAYTVFSKLQNAGFAGLYGNMLMSAVGARSGDIPDEVKSLGVDMVQKAYLRYSQAQEAIANRGAGGFDLLGDFLDAYAKDTIQAYRIISNAQRPDLGAREERMMLRQQGKGGGLSASIAKSMVNPFDPMKDLRAAQSDGEIQKALPEVRSALQANRNYDPRLQSSLRSQESPSYYDFVSQIQGPQAGQAALARDQDQQRLTLLKKQELQRLKWETQIVGGPQ